MLTVSMTIIAISLSLTLYLSVEKLRTSAHTSFIDTISKTDLIIGLSRDYMIGLKLVFNCSLFNKISLLKTLIG